MDFCLARGCARLEAILSVGICTQTRLDYKIYDSDSHSPDETSFLKKRINDNDGYHYWCYL